ncbi:Inner membrane protein YbhN [Ensifer adhaerens]|uniref:lysylphosphatidylglycerol synthase domain-containing protein n=1 Tax=Ensifer adhaerens TaxID=106592 RepID=UPI00156972CF|nr:lysylphosphatidylglycerol synthase domain-containing protein [Ensifer adhaerens]NRP21848.1 Inner membrane protein YbhN [Ensifer adhaerens]
MRLFFRIILAVAFCGAIFLLYRTLREYRYTDISSALFSLPGRNITFALVFAAASYACLSCFDALAVRYVRKPLALHQTMLASFVSLSIGHNVGVAALSSAAVRYRYYSRWGLSTADVAVVVVFCGTTVALGLAALGSVALLLRPGDAASMIGVGEGTVYALAIAAGLFPVVYLVFSATSRTPLTVLRWSFRFPPLMTAALQIVVGVLNFAFVAACLHQTLSAFAEASYLKVATVSIVANVAAIISHVPGGIGVLEATVVQILPGAESVAAVIAFRTIYYFVPIMIGLPLLGVSELVIKERDASGPKAKQA